MLSYSLPFVITVSIDIAFNVRKLISLTFYTPFVFNSIVTNITILLRVGLKVVFKILVMGKIELYTFYLTVMTI